MHVDVKSKWGELRCHCSRIPILRLSKTARNLNKVFLTCGTPASAETRCKYFQGIHTALFIDKRPLHKLKYATNLSRAEWMKQAEANVETRKQHNGWYNKQDAQTRLLKQPNKLLNQPKKKKNKENLIQVILGRAHHCQVPLSQVQRTQKTRAMEGGC